MVGVWNVWQLATVPGSGLVLPAPGLFVLQNEPVPHTKQAETGPNTLQRAPVASLAALTSPSTCLGFYIQLWSSLTSVVWLRVERFLLLWAVPSVLQMSVKYSAQALPSRCQP